MKELEKQISYKMMSVSEMEESDRKLYLAALEASDKAYAPYSEFQVGAAVLLENGEIVTGSNQENAAYPSGLCAERVALFSAGALFPNVPVIALAIIAQASGEVKETISPCGACCQVMVETEMRSGNQMRILLCGKENVQIIESVSSLLPFSFSANQLD